MNAEDATKRWIDRSYVEAYLFFTRGVEFDPAAWAKKLRVDQKSVVLDLGCGEGKLLRAFAPKISRGIGIDLSSIALDRGRQLSRRS